MIKYPWNKFVALTVIVAPLIAMLCGATTVHYVDILNTGHDVPPYTNWATAALTIEDALALTASGSIVRVAAGIYLPTSSLTITNPTVRVESVSGAGSTMVCGDGTFSLFTFIAPGAAVCGFTLTNGGGSSAGGVLAAAASTVERCIVTGNNVLGNGGGLFANSVAALQVSDCMIVGNSADNGGGVYLQNAAAFVRNSICAFNSAPGKGAGIYAENAMIENCSVVSNTGQGVYLLQARVLNSIVYDNAAENIAGTSIALTNVCTMPDPGAGGIGVLTNNPRFVSAGGDFRLRCASPCIDLSTPAGWMTAAVDQYSSPRVSGVAPDLGAAEFPYPYLDITSHVGIASGPTNWVSFDVASLLLSGTNRYSITTNLYANALTTNLVVVGGMWAVNLAQGATSMFQAALGWHAPEVPLQTGANAIVVFGTNDVDGITNDILIVTRGADGTGTPFVDITNGTSASVNFDVTSYIIGGTNWQIAGGTLWWSNTLVAGATQFSASGANGAFSLAINNVQVGANVIRVYGTNMLGVCASDMIMITRGADGTGTPFVDITNGTSASVNFDVTSYTIGGTNWQIAGGTLWWSNTLVAGAAQFSASAVNGAFSLAISNVQVGANVIRVYGTNMLGVCAGDTIMITRGADGTGTPFVDITNSTSVSVNFDVTSYAIGGTNWQIAGGTLWWSNTLVAGATQFSASAVNGAFGLLINNVQVGANVIHVYGTNMLGVCAGDMITITRGADGTGTPFVDITNGTSASVNFDVTSHTIGGTNWQIAGGTLWWSNTLVAGATQFSASSMNGAFSLLINNVQVGANVIRVYGTNMLGVCAGDMITITRQSTNAPAIEVLVNWPLHLQAGQIGWVEFVAQTGVQYGLYTAAMLTNGSGPLSSLIATNTAATLDFSVAQTQAGAQGPLLLYLAAMADMRSATQLPRTNVFVATVGPAVLKGKLRFFQIVESDGDIAEVYYAGLGTPRMEGRSVFITGAGVADTLYLKVTAPKKPAISDRRFPLDWVSAANLKSIKWHGQVDDIHISNVLKTVKISAGSLGFAYDRRAVSRHGLQVGAELRSVTVQAKKAKDGTCYGGSALGAFNVGPDAKAKGWMMKVSGISYKGLTGTVSTVTIDLCSHTLKALITKFADVIGTRVVVTNEIGMLAARSANIYDSYVVAHFMKTIVATAKKGYASGLIADSQFYSRGGDKQRIGIRAIKAYQFVDGHATNSNICLRKTIFAAGIIPPLCTNNLTSTFSIKTLTPKAAPLQGVFSSQLEFKNPRLRPAPAAPSYIKIINGALP